MSVYVSEDFQGLSNGNLAGQGDWILGMSNGGTANIQVADSSGDKRLVVTGDADAGAIVYLNRTFKNNHFARCTLDAMAADKYMGLAVRCRGTGATFDCYGLNIASGYMVIYKVVNGTPTLITSGASTTTIGNVYELRAVGSTITVYRNGTQYYQFTDSDVADGAPGVSSSVSTLSLIHI